MKVKTKVLTIEEIKKLPEGTVIWKYWGRWYKGQMNTEVGEYDDCYVDSYPENIMEYKLKEKGEK